MRKSDNAMDTFTLKFNSSNAVNTGLAKDYLRSNEIKQIPHEEPLNIPLSVLLKKLAQKVVENTELFCQLEYLANGASAHDVRNNIKLIEQNLNFHNKNCNAVSSVHLYDDMPLAALGYVGLLSLEQGFELYSTKIRAAAYLFTKLCHEVGLRNVSYDPVITPGQYSNKWKPPIGSTGVIAERSDLDSAVDAFLSSSTTCFWRLNRILVQESIYESFKKAVEWKCGLKGHSSTEVRNELRTLCTEAFVYDDKYLLMDFAGEESTDRSVLPLMIYVEAYRTTKELLSLIAKYDDSCLSLWSSDIAEANEISYNVTSHLVWLNDFGNFDGPPVGSQWFYSNCLRDPLLPFHEPDVKVTQLWRKYDHKTRLNIIYEALDTHKSDVELVFKIQDKILKLNSNTSIDISKSRLCVSINLPVGIISFPKACNDVECLVDIIELLINGNTMEITHTNDVFKPLLQVLKTAGVPIFFSMPSEPFEKRVTSIIYLYRTRVILSNYGTIFAN